MLGCGIPTALVGLGGAALGAWIFYQSNYGSGPGTGIGLGLIILVASLPIALLGLGLLLGGIVTVRNSRGRA